MRLRSSDERFLLHVDQWWNMLLPRVAPYLHKNGGPILMVQARC
jgi:beta-galactosidase